MKRRLLALAEFLALRRDLALLLVAIVLIGAGEELWMRFLPKYLQALGAGVLVIGLFDALRTLVAAVYAYPGGVLADRLGHRRAFLLFNLLSIGGYALVLLIPHWAGVMIGMLLFLSWSCFSLPAMFSLVAAVLKRERYAMGIGVQAVVKRFPIMVAPIIGGLLIDRFGVVTGTRLGLVMSIALSAATLFVQRQVKERETPMLTPAPWNFRRTLRAFDPPLTRLLWSDILVRFAERIPFAWVIIYAIDHIGVSAGEFGLLTTIEMIVAASCLIPTSHYADKFGRRPFVIISFAMFALFPLAVYLSGSFAMLAGAFVVRGLKEFGDTARKALLVEFVAAERRGQMIGTYYLLRDFVVSFGALIGAVLWKLGPATNFLTATAVGVAGTLFYVYSTRGERLRIT